MVWIWRLSHALQKVPSYTDLKSAICPGISSKKYQSKKCPLIYSLKNGLLPRKKINKNCFTYKAGPRQSFLISKKSPHHHVRYDTKTPKNFWGIPLTKNYPPYLFIWKRQNVSEFWGIFLTPSISPWKLAKTPGISLKKTTDWKRPLTITVKLGQKPRFSEKNFFFLKKSPLITMFKNGHLPRFLLWRKQRMTGLTTSSSKNLAFSAIWKMAKNVLFIGEKRKRADSRGNSNKRNFTILEAYLAIIITWILPRVFHKKR